MIGMKRAVLDGNPSQGNILPHSTRRFDLAWTKKNLVVEGMTLPTSFWSAVGYEWDNFAFGKYTATISLLYTSKNLTDTASTTFYVLPWQLLLVIITGLVLVYLILRKILRSYNKMLIAQVREKIEEEVEEKMEEKLEQQQEQQRKKKTHIRPKV
jgi:hypothetical protein